MMMASLMHLAVLIPDLAATGIWVFNPRDRTLISPTERWGWTPVSLKINTRHTHRK